MNAVTLATYEAYMIKPEVIKQTAIGVDSRHLWTIYVDALGTMGMNHFETILTSPTGKIEHTTQLPLRVTREAAIELHDAEVIKRTTGSKPVKTAASFAASGSTVANGGVAGSNKSAAASAAAAGQNLRTPESALDEAIVMWRENKASARLRPLSPLVDTWLATASGVAGRQ
jgi:hypothetical protein